jgi:hypothetical protein
MTVCSVETFFAGGMWLSVQLNTPYGQFGSDKLIVFTDESTGVGCLELDRVAAATCVSLMSGGHPGFKEGNAVDAPFP